MTNAMVFPNSMDFYSNLMVILSLLSIAATAFFWLGYGRLIGKDRPVIKYTALITGALVIVGPVVNTAIARMDQTALFQMTFSVQRVISAVQLAAIAVFLWMFVIKGSLPLRVTAGMYILSLSTNQFLFWTWFPAVMWVSAGVRALMTLPFYITLILHQTRIARSEASMRDAAEENPS